MTETEIAEFMRHRSGWRRRYTRLGTRVVLEEWAGNFFSMATTGRTVEISTLRYWVGYWRVWFERRRRRRLPGARVIR